MNKYEGFFQKLLYIYGNDFMVSLLYSPNKVNCTDFHMINQMCIPVINNTYLIMLLTFLHIAVFSLLILCSLILIYHLLSPYLLFSFPFNPFSFAIHC